MERRIHATSTLKLRRKRSQIHVARMWILVVDTTSQVHVEYTFLPLKFLFGNTDESTEQADSIDDLTDQQETLLTSGFVADSGVKIVPGEGNMPLSLTLDEDMDVLAFPTVYGGKQRIFKVKYTPVEMAKAEARHHDRRVATNIPKVMMNFCKSRIHKLKSRVNINLRKKVKTNAVTVSQILNDDNLSSIIQHNDGYKIVATDRSSPAFWQGKQKKVMAMLRQFCGKCTKCRKSKRGHSEKIKENVPVELHK
ncbi:LOW QUALITY PROTEIN: Trigger factor [Frankliniella fusca]|uniref:Trigger factor n=1 Tax=Frankliniella fusca TaxID=407009 RepID=A0AAE1LFM6_9NEOP|nr:LOW QUALITY PROTEIN: Trigger factor [Frankliniella fusca]